MSEKRYRKPVEVFNKMEAIVTLVCPDPKNARSPLQVSCLPQQKTKMEAETLELFRASPGSAHLLEHCFQV